MVLKKEEKSEWGTNDVLCSNHGLSRWWRISKGEITNFSHHTSNYEARNRIIAALSSFIHTQKRWRDGIICFLSFLCNMVGTWELEVMRDHLREALSRVTTSLIQQLTRRDRLLLERDRHFDVITAILQAASQKRSNTIKWSNLIIQVLNLQLGFLRWPL